MNDRTTQNTSDTRESLMGFAVGAISAGVASVLGGAVLGLILMVGIALLLYGFYGKKAATGVVIGSIVAIAALLIIAIPSM